MTRSWTRGPFVGTVNPQTPDRLPPPNRLPPPDRLPPLSSLILLPPWSCRHSYHRHSSPRLLTLLETLRNNGRPSTSSQTPSSQPCPCSVSSYSWTSGPEHRSGISPPTPPDPLSTSPWLLSRILGLSDFPEWGWVVLGPTESPSLHPLVLTSRIDPLWPSPLWNWFDLYRVSGVDSPFRPGSPQRPTNWPQPPTPLYRSHNFHRPTYHVGNVPCQML